jgi:hypothetical protein
VRLDFVCGDEVYGSCTGLREHLEGRSQPYVLRVPSSFRFTPASGITLTCKQAAARLGSRRGWEIRSAGTGSKGQRWYAWAWLGPASARHYLAPSPLPCSAAAPGPNWAGNSRIADRQPGIMTT